MTRKPVYPLRDVYTAISDHIIRHGYPPSVREIADAVGIKSPATVQRKIGQLADLGLISHVPGKNRTINILRAWPTEAG